MDIHPISDLQRFPVQVQSFWKSKIVTTDPPKYYPHTEYSIIYDLLSTDTVFLAVLMLRSRDKLNYQRFWRSAANASLTINLSFFPWDWKQSDKVQISFYQQVPIQGGGVSVVTNSSRLKQDPKQLVHNWEKAHCKIQTGAVVPFASIDIPGPLQAEVLLVAKGDTQKTQGKWRLKPSLNDGLPDSLAFLTNGRCTGTIDL
jgi:hypothetical protein